MKRAITIATLLCFTACADGGNSRSDTVGQGEKPPLVAPNRIAELLEAHNVPGMSYAELRGCEVVETGAVGFANIQAGEPTRKRTAFEAASLSKPVFAWLVMSLVDEGAIKLDEPFAASGFTYSRIPDKQRYARLTPRLVLMHRTGLPNWAGRPRNPDRDDPIEFIHEPGAAHSYSGEAYLLLQTFVEERTGQSLQSLFDKRLAQLMSNSAFRRPLPVSLFPSRGYFNGEEDRSDEVAPFTRENAAYSLVTTASDFAQFLSVVCRGDNLTSEAYQDMLRVQTAGMPQGDLSKQWRLGWESLTIKGRETVFHSGDNGNYMSMALYFVDNGEGYVVMTNGESGIAFINEFLREARAGERL